MSVIQHKSQRVAIFIDTQNLYHCAKNLYNGKVNFQQVLLDCLGERILIRAVAYLISTESGDEDMFFDALLAMGIETKSKDLLIYSGGIKKADWDVGITVDAIRIASKVDTVVLATGDGDFVPLVEHLKSMGVQVEVVSFGKSTSGKLRESAEAFLDLCDSPERYVFGYKNRIRKSLINRNYKKTNDISARNLTYKNKKHKTEQNIDNNIENLQSSNVQEISEQNTLIKNNTNRQNTNHKKNKNKEISNNNFNNTYNNNDILVDNTKDIVNKNLTSDNIEDNITDNIKNPKTIDNKTKINKTQVKKRIYKRHTKNNNITQNNTTDK